MIMPCTTPPLVLIKDTKTTTAHLKVHCPQLFAPTRQKRAADVNMKLGKRIRALRLAQIRARHQEMTRECTYEIRVPHPDRILHAQLAHQQAVHPSECKLHKLDILRLEVLCQRCCFNRRQSKADRVKASHTVYSPDETCKISYATMNPWLSRDVVVLDPVEKFG